MIPSTTHVRSEIVMGGIDTRLQPLHHVFQLPTPTVINESKRQETELRKRIRDIYDDPSLESKEKARKVQVSYKLYKKQNNESHHWIISNSCRHEHPLQ